MAKEQQVILVPDFLTVRELADLMESSPIDVMKKLIANGIMASINQQIDYETAALIISEFGLEAKSETALEVEIEEAKLLAITIIEERFFFIGSNGKLIDYNNSKKNLPYVFGKIDVDNFVHFVEVVEQSKFDFNKIKEIYFFPSGRWDIKTKDDKLFKLPIENIEFKLNSINEIYINNKFKNAKIIDLRIKNKIIITNE